MFCASNLNKLGYVCETIERENERVQMNNPKIYQRILISHQNIHLLILDAVEIDFVLLLWIILLCVHVLMTLLNWTKHPKTDRNIQN